MVEELKARPFIKFVGGKAKLAPKVVELTLSQNPKRYYEPFFGGGAVFWALRNAGFKLPAVINDLNGEITIALEAIRDHPRDVADKLAEIEEAYHTAADKETKESIYYGLREDRNRVSVFGDQVLIAQRLIALNKLCFNGLYRVNKSGGFNVPWGRYVKPGTPMICDPENLGACSKALGNTRIENVNFAASLADAEKGHMIYADPPYAPVSKTANFVSYQAGGFTWQDQEELAKLLRQLSRRGVKFILSNADMPEVRKLYSGFTIEQVMMARNVNSNSAKRGKVAEVLVRNF